MSLTERQIRKRRTELAAEDAELKAALDEKERNKRIPCEKCGKRTRVRDLTYIQTYFYIDPYSCTGGDYWKQGEGQYDCPKCGRRNRLYDRPDVVKLRWLFKEIVKAHNR